MIDNLDVEFIHDELLKTASSLLNTHDPLAIAAVMMVCSLSIYRTALSEDDYNQVVENILSKKDLIKIFDSGYLH